MVIEKCTHGIPMKNPRVLCCGPQVINIKLPGWMPWMVDWPIGHYISCLSSQIIRINDKRKRFKHHEPFPVMGRGICKGVYYGMNRSHNFQEILAGIAWMSSNSAPLHMRSMEVLTQPTHSPCSRQSVRPINWLPIILINHVARSLFLNEDMVLRAD